MQFQKEIIDFSGSTKGKTIANRIWVLSGCTASANYSPNELDPSKRLIVSTDAGSLIQDMPLPFLNAM